MPSSRGVRVGVYALVLPWIPVLFWNTYHGFRIWLCGIPLVLLVAAGVRRWADRPGFKAAETLLWNAVLAFLLLEGGVRAYIGFGDPPAWVTPEPHHLRYRLHPEREWLGTRPNSQGFYDEEFAPKTPGRTRVVVLGDSYTVGIVPYQDNYVTIVDAELGDETELLNLGVSHTAPPEYLRILREEGFALEPDLVVLSLFLGNDIGTSAPSGLFSRSGSALLQTIRMGWIVLTQGAPYRYDNNLDGLLVLEPDGSLRESAGMSEDDHLRRGWKHLQQIHRPPQDARQQRDWDVTLETIETIVLECRARKIPLVVTLAPEEVQISDSYRADVLKRYHARADDFDLHYAARRLRDKLEELAVPTLDLHDAIHEAERESPTYHLRALHWNRQGNLAAARALTPWLRQQLVALAPRPPRRHELAGRRAVEGEPSPPVASGRP